jgi:hypothetical protein
VSSVTHGRHRRAKASTRARTLILVAPPLAIFAAALVLRLPDGGSDALVDVPPTTLADLDRSADNDVSRGLSGDRPAILRTLVEQGTAVEEQPTASTRGDTLVTATGKRFLTADLNVWTGPGESFHLATVLDTGSTVLITGVVKGEWAQILYAHEVRWVRASYLSKDKPTDPVVAAGGVTQAPCRLGSGVESGLTPDAIRVYRSVCAAFPAVTSYGGVRPDGEHGEGRALDIMVSSSVLGDAIADWVRANAARLGASEVLWAQHIWTVERSSEGWRLFPDRGSATANHFDHVHVTVYGSSGG